MSEILTIFDAPEDFGPNFQRRLGFWYSHQINPAAVMKGVEMEALDSERVRVRYKAVVLPEGQSQWEPLIPAGILCDHDNQPHRAVVERFIDVPISEVALTFHETGVIPSMSARRAAQVAMSDHEWKARA